VSSELVVERPAWESATDSAVARFTYGETIPRAWLDEQFGIVWPDLMTKAQAQRINLRFFSMMHNFTDAMLHRHKMALRADNHGGWLIVPPGQQHLFAVERLRKDVDRAVRRAGDTIDNTRTEDLTNDEAKARRAAQAKIAAFESMTNKKLTDKMPAATLPAEGQE